MKIKCPYCGEMNKGNICTNCGFDSTFDIVSLSTLCNPAGVDMLQYKNQLLSSEVHLLRNDLTSVTLKFENAIKELNEKCDAIKDKCEVLDGEASETVSQSKPEMDFEQANAASQRNNFCSIGDVIRFGTYPQSQKDSGIKEPIEWIVLDRRGSSTLVISKYAIDCVPYNAKDAASTWETSSLRTWLNNDFYFAAFSDGDRTEILQTTVSADNNPQYGTDSGNCTSDYIFLLSASEVEKYFSTDRSRRCTSTAYAKARGAYRSILFNSPEGKTCWWWLRSPGAIQNNAAGVYVDGSIKYFGHNVASTDDCVRPAMWINI